MNVLFIMVMVLCLFDFDFGNLVCWVFEGELNEYWIIGFKVYGGVMVVLCVNVVCIVYGVVG